VRKLSKKRAADDRSCAERSQERQHSLAPPGCEEPERARLQRAARAAARAGVATGVLEKAADEPAAACPSRGKLSPRKPTGAPLGSCGQARPASDDEAIETTAAEGSDGSATACQDDSSECGHDCGYEAGSGGRGTLAEAAEEEAEENQQEDLPEPRVLSHGLKKPRAKQHKEAGPHLQQQNVTELRMQRHLEVQSQGAPQKTKRVPREATEVMKREADAFVASARQRGLADTEGRRQGPRPKNASKGEAAARTRGQAEQTASRPPAMAEAVGARAGAWEAKVAARVEARDARARVKAEARAARAEAKAETQSTRAATETHWPNRKEAEPRVVEEAEGQVGASAGLRGKAEAAPGAAAEVKASQRQRAKGLGRPATREWRPRPTPELEPQLAMAQAAEGSSEVKEVQERPRTGVKEAKTTALGSGIQAAVVDAAARAGTEDEAVRDAAEAEAAAQAVVEDEAAQVTVEGTAARVAMVAEAASTAAQAEAAQATAKGDPGLALAVVEESLSLESGWELLHGAVEELLADGTGWSVVA